MEKILSEIEKNNNQLTDYFQLQDELTNSENEHFSLQIRFDHTSKENELLRAELVAKSKACIEQKYWHNLPAWS